MNDNNPETRLTGLELELFIAREERDAARTEAYIASTKLRGAENKLALVSSEGLTLASLANSSAQQGLLIESVRTEFDTRLGEALKRIARLERRSETGCFDAWQAGYEAGTSDATASECGTGSEPHAVNPYGDAPDTMPAPPGESWSGASVIPRGGSGYPTELRLCADCLKRKAKSAVAGIAGFLLCDGCSSAVGFSTAATVPEPTHLPRVCVHKLWSCAECGWSVGHPIEILR